MYAEIRNTHCWGPLYEPNTDIYADINPDLLAGISIDTWKTDDPNEEGVVVANVLLTISGNIVVDFHDNAARLNPQVMEFILQTKDTLAKEWEVHCNKLYAELTEAEVMTPVSFSFPGNDEEIHKASHRITEIEAILENDLAESKEEQRELEKELFFLQRAVEELEEHRYTSIDYDNLRNLNKDWDLLWYIYRFCSKAQKPMAEELIMIELNRLFQQNDEKGDAEYAEKLPLLLAQFGAVFMWGERHLTKAAEMFNGVPIEWGMTEKQWENYRHDHNIGLGDGGKLSEDADVYGYVTFGNIRADFQHTLDEGDWYPFVNAFALGVDSGYGKTEKGTPYDLLCVDPDVEKLLVSAPDFTSFKEEFAAVFRAFVFSLPEKYITAHDWSLEQSTSM